MGLEIEDLIILVLFSLLALKPLDAWRVSDKVAKRCLIFDMQMGTSDLKNSILQKLSVFGSKWVKKLYYKIPIAVVSTGVKYDTFVVKADEDLRVLFHCVRSFPEIRIHELFAKLEDGVESSGASAPVPGSTAAGGASSSMPTVRLYLPPVASPLFAADLDRTEVVSSVPLENAAVFEPPHDVGTGGGLLTYMEGFGGPDRVENAMCDDDSDQEPVDIVGDSDDDTGRGGNTVGGSSTEFQIGQSFQNKDEAVLSVKDYSIRADAAVTVKVLQQATEADYGFRPSYRKVWMAKQKAVAQIYGDWEESYADLPRWILGVQSTMPGTITVLKTSPVRLRGEVDESTYGGTLLLAIAQDGNSNILPIAFALVEGENIESWSFFLSNLREHVTPQEGILVIYDRHNGIKAALEAPENGWLPPCAF
ncbi:uncharacterized protein LOC107469869 [Arachis duranensis]|uniref:Uncharacterized protein LOC107469869 n=1 Tax=Arachis duranensis TaxID=130453 RepID=A0A6P4BMM9_ARADU|nr:uncharacterized protein LOC107469869 [Arachis duranensis]